MCWTKSSYLDAYLRDITANSKQKFDFMYLMLFFNMRTFYVPQLTGFYDILLPKCYLRGCECSNPCFFHHLAFYKDANNCETYNEETPLFCHMVITSHEEK